MIGEVKLFLNPADISFFNRKESKMLIDLWTKVDIQNMVIVTSGGLALVTLLVGLFF
jgi:hypothetical protein